MNVDLNIIYQITSNQGLNNIVWGSVKDLVKEMNLSYSTLVKKLNGQRKNNTTYKYFRCFKKEGT